MIIIYGPTGVGKTDFAEMLASRIPAEIVNADLGQFYTPLTVGTAKPNWRNSPIPQHHFDIINEPSLISVSQYRDYVKQTLEGIWTRKNIPILVGGSGFYIQSLFFPPSSGAGPNLTSKHAGDVTDRWNQLYTIDPVRALKIHPNDLYRINRALDIFYSTGQKPSDCPPSYQPITSFYFVYLTRDRDDLYERINMRTHTMITHGWIEEVQRLKDTSWESFLKIKKIIGYDDILYYLEGEKTDNNLTNLFETIAQKTRNYAKRQITFGNQLLGQLEKQIIKNQDTVSKCVQFNLTSSNLELYINQLLEVFNRDMKIGEQ